MIIKMEIQIENLLSKKRENTTEHSNISRRDRCLYAKESDIKLFQSILDNNKKICKICGGKWHTSDACGNTFMMNKIMKVVPDNLKEAWYAIKYQCLSKKGSDYCRQKCLKNNEKFQNNRQFKSLNECDRLDLDYVSLYYDGLKDTYECTFCKGKGHVFPECSVKWLFNQNYDKCEFGLGPAWRLIKLEHTELYRKSMEMQNKNIKQTITEQIKEKVNESKPEDIEIN